MSFTLKIFYQNMLYNILYVIYFAFIVLKQNTIIYKQNTYKNAGIDEDEDEDEEAIYLRFQAIYFVFLINCTPYAK